MATTLAPSMILPPDAAIPSGYANPAGMGGFDISSLLKMFSGLGGVAGGSSSANGSPIPPGAPVSSVTPPIQSEILAPRQESTIQPSALKDVNTRNRAEELAGLTFGLATLGKALSPEGSPGAKLGQSMIDYSSGVKLEELLKKLRQDAKASVHSGAPSSISAPGAPAAF